MKNKIIFGIILIIVFLAFISCANKNANISGDTSRQTGGSSGNNVITFEAQYIRIGSGLGQRTPVCAVISSLNELNQYTNSLRSSSFWETEYLNTISKYTNNYFSNNFLVIIFLQENSGSNRHRVDKIDFNGDIIIERLVPEIGTSDMATWNIIIELNNNFKSDKYQILMK